jgi:uncharacterized MAPEG superfamily protein
MTIALWCLFIAGVLHALSKTPLAIFQAKAPGGYDNNMPREQQASLEGIGKRALAIHTNQIESFPLFAAGVLVASLGVVNSNMVDYLAIAYVLSRVVYIFVYLKDLATLRSLIWGVGYMSSLALLCSPAWA